MPKTSFLVLFLTWASKSSIYQTWWSLLLLFCCFGVFVFLIHQSYGRRTYIIVANGWKIPAATLNSIITHSLTHWLLLFAGIRDFCCKLCNYKGVTQSDLNRHMKSQIHLLKSQNECQHCREGFVTARNLEKHLDGNCIVKMHDLDTTDWPVVKWFVQGRHVTVR